jgi:(p)ppGpp synthase/HD superfamily hydrolase
MNREQILVEFHQSYGYLPGDKITARDFSQFWHTVKHKQKRYMGEDYWASHLYPVATLSANHSKGAIEVAYLHDILEDTDCTEELLREIFDKDVVDDVVLLTHNRNESRDVYYAKIRTSPRALIVKMADVAHNISCLTNLTDLELRDRLTNKYIKAIKHLMLNQEE